MQHSLINKSFLLLGGAVAGFLILEVVLRLVGAETGPGRYLDTSSPVSNSRWIAHPFLPYAGRPSARFRLYEPGRPAEIVVTNSYGFRAHEFPPQKNPGDFFILAFGGSTTYGYPVASNEETWPEVLERKLAARYPDKHVVAFNFGIDMADNLFGVVNLALVGVHLAPDLVISYEGYNDVAALGFRNFRTDQAHFYKDIDPDKVFRGLQRSTPSLLLHSRVIYSLTGTLDLLLGMNDLAVSALMPEDPDPDRLRGIESVFSNLKTMDAIAKGYGAKAVFSTFQFTYEHTHPEYERFNEELRRYLDANAMLWIDQAALIPDEDPTINVDDCHFTPKGNEMLADNFFHFIVDHHLVE